MVTCPSSKVSPVRTSCKDGVDSATQRSCTGLVKTPTLDFERVEVAAEDIVAAVEVVRKSLSTERHTLQTLWRWGERVGLMGLSGVDHSGNKDVPASSDHS